MSRYDFPGIDPQSRLSIGWDRPLRTFFVQVTKTSPPSPDATDDNDHGGEDHGGEDHAVVWLGTNPGELPYAADAIRIAKAHAVLPPDIGRTLELDRLRTAGDSDGPAQHAARPFLKGED